MGINPDQNWIDDDDEQSTLKNINYNATVLRMQYLFLSGLVDFTIGLVDFDFYLLDGQEKCLWGTKILG